MESYHKVLPAAQHQATNREFVLELASRLSDPDDAPLCSVETERDLLNFFLIVLKKPENLLSGVIINIASVTYPGNTILPIS